MNERIIIDALKNIGLQLRNMQAKIIDLDSDIKSLGQSRGVTGYKVVPFGVKDITLAQLVDAYKRGLDLEQLVALANGKYTAEQIYKKLSKMGGM